MDLIPLTDSPRQALTVALGGQSLHLDLWWQPLSAHWYLSVANLDGTAIALGRQVAPLVRLVRAAAFEGEIVAVPRHAGDMASVGRSGWQDTHTLAYFTAAETAVVEWP